MGPVSHRRTTWSLPRTTWVSGERLQRRLRAPRAELAACVAELVNQVSLHWPERRDQLAVNPRLVASIESHIASGSRSLLRQVEDL